jgi:hypothetical protein
VHETLVHDLAGELLDPGGRRPLADADGDDAGRQQQDVAALDVLVAPAVERAGIAMLVTATWSLSQTDASRV